MYHNSINLIQYNDLTIQNQFTCQWSYGINIQYFNFLDDVKIYNGVKILNTISQETEQIFIFEIKNDEYY